MMFVDAYLLYKAFRGDNAKKYPPREFFEQLACNMIDMNTRRVTFKGTPKTQSGILTHKEETLRRLLNSIVQRKTSVKKSKNTQHSKQGHCIECGTHTVHICAHCSDLIQGNREIFICKETNKKPCWRLHLQHVHLNY